jgi:hypothetical protein
MYNEALFEKVAFFVNFKILLFKRRITQSGNAKSQRVLNISNLCIKALAVFNI